MKKIMLSIVACLMAISVNAQSQDATPFTAGKMYLHGGFSGLNLKYNSTEKWNLDVTAKVGYFLQDNFMVLGNANWGLHQETPNDFSIGAGARYYIEQNGLYLGAGASYKHACDYDDFVPTVNIGYCFFLSHTVTVEPELYYDFSTKSFKDYSSFGFRVGFGIYL